MRWGGVTTDSHSGYFHFVHDSKRNSVITGRLGNQTAYVEMQKKMVRPKITCVTGQASVACLENGGQQYYLEDVLRGLNKIRHVIYCTWYIITAQ